MYSSLLYHLTLTVLPASVPLLKWPSKPFAFADSSSSISNITVAMYSPVCPMAAGRWVISEIFSQWNSSLIAGLQVFPERGSFFRFIDC